LRSQVSGLHAVDPPADARPVNVRTQRRKGSRQVIEKRAERWQRPSRQLPDWTDDSRPFWTSGADGVLRINRCADCGTYHHPPAPICHQCLGRAVSPTPVSGRGTIVSFTINHQSWMPGLPTPFVIAYVGIDEQPDIWLMTNILGCAPEQVAIGQRVRVVFEQQEDAWIPLFIPEGLADD